MPQNRLERRLGTMLWGFQDDLSREVCCVDRSDTYVGLSAVLSGVIWMMIGVGGLISGVSGVFQLGDNLLLCLQENPG
jgi:hypothetical protein